jgi:hypothetical protein
MARGNHPVGKRLHAVQGGHGLAGAGGKQAVKVVAAILQQVVPPPTSNTASPQRCAPKNLSDREFGNRGQRWPTLPDSGGLELGKLQHMALPQIQGVIAQLEPPAPGGTHRAADLSGPGPPG